MRSAANAVLSIIFAPGCAACGAVQPAPLRGPVCEACWHAVRLITPPVCDGCGDPVSSWQVAGASLPRCPRCSHAGHAVDRGRTVGEYQGALRQIIHALKYEGRRSIARDLGMLMKKQGGRLLAGVDGAVPVPLHPARERARGFNQAEALARRLPIPVWDVLRRTRATLPQVELPEARRHANVAGAFAVTVPRRWPTVCSARASALSGACVLLVDDVSTTGATLEACARALKEAGVREVRALTAARVVRRQCAPRRP
jgi:ComF family protein